MNARQDLYKAARLLGDVNAAKRGPTAYAKRRARRVVYRGGFRVLRAILRMAGL